MSRLFRRLFFGFLFVCLLVGTSVQAEELFALIPVRGGTLEIQATEIGEEYWFFLPSDTDVGRLAIVKQDGSIIPYQALLSEKDGVFSADCEDVSIRMMRSENIRSLFLISEDPIQYGRTYIDESFAHSTYTTGSLFLVGENGSIDHAERIKKLRGRGNGTWAGSKKPYQIKLENKTNLLDTGNYEERDRTWILLALATDSTYLHDRLTFDLARELGDDTASNSEHVNLYYDGEYRGLYLLCEKTEIGSGRIDELDYDNIIEEMFERAGRSDLEELTVASAANSYGNTFSYMEDMIEPNLPGTGAFLLELETYHTLTDPCWFTLSNGLTFSSKNPEKVSHRMMTYISERLEEALQALQNRGVYPEGGRTLADDFDIEDFTRSILISELSGNLDSYVYSSTFFVLPAGEERFSAGPPWDYDLAYRYKIHRGVLSDATGFRDKTGLIPLFLGCQEVRDTAKRIVTEQLSSAVWEILLGTRQGAALRPIDEYVEEIDAARRMNEMIWTVSPNSRLLYSDSFEQEIDMLKQYLSERGSWLFDTISKWDSPDETIDIWADAAYTNVETDVSVSAYSYSNMQVTSFEWKQLTESTEEDYAVWQMDICLEAVDGYHFDHPAITVNGVPVEASEQEDGSFAISFTFEDPSYRPVDAYGEDIGLIYNHDVYVRRHPEVAALCDNDPEQILDYFLDEGMYEGHQANDFFAPEEILLYNQYVEEFLGTDWWLYYQDYLAYGYSEWVLPVDARFDLIPLE